jgi:outer membrane protein insertion porin family
MAQEPLGAPVGDTAAVAGVRLDTVLVSGNRRLPDAQIRATAALRSGATISEVDVQRAIRRLMASGNFESVAVLSLGDPRRAVSLTLQVVERPLVAGVEFPGLQSVGAGTVRDTVGWERNQPLDPNRVVRTEAMIRDLLARRGVQLLSVDTTLIPVEGTPESFRLAFNVREGNRLAISDIVFEGNQTYSDAALRGAMSTRPEGFFWFRSGRFDREVFTEDLRRRLPDFYAERGYIDFAVVSDTLIVDPNTGKAQLRVAVAEGPQYRLGNFDVEGNSRFSTEQLTRMFTLQRRSVLGLPFGGVEQRERGEVFNRVALNDATQRVSTMYRNQGYLYAQVEPVINRVPAADGASPTVDVTWAVSERSPFYIRRINIHGNTYTHESVIRDRLWVLPGSVYNEELLVQSYQSVAGLGFFETPMPLPDIDPSPETGEVDITFHVTEKQTGNINFGTSIGGGYAGAGGGLSGFLGYSQPNLFGQGKQANLRVEYGLGRSRFETSFVDPALFGTRNSGSISLFHTDDRYSPFNNGRRVRTGGALQFGVPVPGLLRTRAFAGYSLTRNSYRAVGDECAESESVFCLPTSTASTASLSLTRDTKNSPLFPTAGTRQSISGDQTGGPLGGNGNFQKVTTDVEWWVPAGSFGGGAPGARPIRLTLGLQARGGAVFGDASRFPLEKFLLGGVQFGQPLRGYEDASITPFGYNQRCSQLRPECVGAAFLTVTGQYAARLNDNLSVHLFGDAGNSWSSVGQIDPSRLFRGAGLGATVVTPFGPIGLDAAYGFDRRDVGGNLDPAWKLHFRLGQTF